MGPLTSGDPSTSAPSDSSGVTLGGLGGMVESARKANACRITDESPDVTNSVPPKLNTKKVGGPEGVRTTLGAKTTPATSATEIGSVHGPGGWARSASWTQSCAVPLRVLLGAVGGPGSSDVEG